MYAWIWRHLPGSVATKWVTAGVLIVGVIALLLFVVFPWAEPMLPFNGVAVQ